MTSWDIVFFLRDNTSEYVPTSWAVDTNKDVYLWPKKLSETQIKKLRDNCSEPSVNIEYEEWAGICKATVYNLKHAQNLAEKAEYTSNLSSAAETVERLVENVDNDTVDDEGDELSDDNLESLRCMLKNKPGKNDNYSTSQVSTPTGFKGFSSSQRILTSCFTKTPISRTSFTINSSSKTPTSAKSNNEDPADLSRDIKKITKALAGIKYDITEIKKDINDIKININMLSENRSKSCMLSSDFKLPMTTSEELQDLENKIENITDLQDLVNVLSHVGGDTIKKNVHFIMKKVMNRELSLKYSARGKKQKNDLSKLYLYKAVLEATKVNFSNATDLEITRYIGISLATAGDRDGGRQHRTEKPNQDV